MILQRRVHEDHSAAIAAAQAADAQAAALQRETDARMQRAAVEAIADFLLHLVPLVSAEIADRIRAVVREARMTLDAGPARKLFAELHHDFVLPVGQPGEWRLPGAAPGDRL